MQDWFSKYPFSDYESAIAHLDKRSARVRDDAPLEHAVRLVRHFVDDDSVSVVYHQTPIVTYWRNGTQALFWNGWYTKTTFEHIERYANLGDLVIRAHNRMRNGRGEAVAWYLNREDWPRTPSRITRCRTCKGSGEAVPTPWNDGRCFNCAGHGEIQRGRVLIPEVHCGALLLTPAKGPFPQTVTIHPVDGLPTYACKCAICRCGCENWTSHWQHAQAEKAAAKKYPPLWASPHPGPVGVDMSAPKPAYKTPGHLGSEVARALEAVLPGMLTFIRCPACPQGTDRTRSVSEQIVHLNDEHRWTREQVADWLESLDVDLTFPVPA